MNHQLIVPIESAGERADKFIAQALPEHSRAFWQKQLEAGHVQQNGKTLGRKDALQEGDVIIALPEHILEALDIPIIYEDDDVIVLNKPAGALTHAKGPEADEATLADFIRPRTTDGLETNRPGIVHRLDRGTSGVIISAKHTEAKRWLQKQFAERKVKKMYQALVHGQLQPPKAVLRLPIARDPKAPQKFRVDSNGKSAETTYKVAEYLPDHSFVALRPLTGRTHQLRVHMAYMGHPIVGDAIYAPATSFGARMFLHAAELEITLPNRERKVFHAPLPDDFAQHLEKLRG